MVHQSTRGYSVLSQTLHHVTIVANGFITQTFALPLVDGRDEVIVSYQLKPNPLLAQLPLAALGDRL